MRSLNNNNNNGGLIYGYNGRLLFTDLQEYTGSYIKQEERRIPLNGLFWFMNEANGFIYCSDQSKDHRLARVDLASRNVDLLGNDPVYGVTLCGEWLYYINESDQRLYRCQLDGRHESRLSEEGTLSFTLNGGTIYYTTGQGIRSCSLTGDGREVISGHAAVHMLFLDGKLVFADKKNHYALTMLDMVDGQAEGYTDIAPNSLNSDGRYLYCANRSNESSIYRIDPKSGTKIRICGESADLLHIVEGDLYFCNHREWYRMSLLGGQAVRVFHVEGTGVKS